jgi:hypothetical protein
VVADLAHFWGEQLEGAFETASGILGAVAAMRWLHMTVIFSRTPTGRALIDWFAAVAHARLARG